jgi:hypothetical protein
MIIGVIVAVLMGGVLWAVLSAAGLRRNPVLSGVIMGGYALRLLIQPFIRSLPFFSHAAGGDSMLYEAWGKLIAYAWSRGGIHFVTAAELPEVGATSLPPNLFAFVTYLNGGEPSPFGGTAIVALAAGLTALNLYLLAVQFGAERQRALLFASIIYFQPAFLFYTSDTYKDGLVLCLTVGALGSALRLAYRLSLRHVLIGLICLAALWFVRFYLIFVTVAPLVVGVVGLNGKGVVRSLLVALALAVGAIALAGYTDLLQLASERATNTFQTGTSDAVIASNSAGGSGVVFDDGGSPLGALPAKLAYTLFSPFLWAGGSLGFHLGKLDVVLWYFVIYRAVRAVRQADRRLVIMLGTFIVPCTLMYAMSMANVGLIVRQRLVIVAAVTILAAIYKPKKSKAKTRARDPRAEQALKKLRAAA